MGNIFTDLGPGGTSSSTDVLQFQTSWGSLGAHEGPGVSQFMDQNLDSAKKAAMQHNSFRHLRLPVNERSLTTLSSYAPMFGCFAAETSSVLHSPKEIKK